MSSRNLNVTNTNLQILKPVFLLELMLQFAPECFSNMVLLFINLKKTFELNMYKSVSIYLCFLSNFLSIVGWFFSNTVKTLVSLFLVLDEQYHLCKQTNKRGII